MLCGREGWYTQAQRHVSPSCSTNPLANWPVSDAGGSIWLFYRPHRPLHQGVGKSYSHLTRQSSMTASSAHTIVQLWSHELAADHRLYNHLPAPLQPGLGIKAALLWQSGGRGVGYFEAQGGEQAHQQLEGL